MTKLMIRIHDVETGKIIDREMTAEEIKSYEENAAAVQALKDATDQKAANKAVLLARLGITAEEAALLLG